MSVILCQSALSVNGVVWSAMYIIRAMAFIVCQNYAAQFVHLFPTDHYNNNNIDVF